MRKQAKIAKIAKIIKNFKIPEFIRYYWITPYSEATEGETAPAGNFPIALVKFGFCGALSADSAVLISATFGTFGKNESRNLPYNSKKSPFFEIVL